MKIYTDSQAKQQFADLQHVAELDDVVIKREDGAFYLLLAKKQLSAFDIGGINTPVSTQEIIEAVRESREQSICQR